MYVTNRHKVVYLHSSIYLFHFHRHQ